MTAKRRLRAITIAACLPYLSLKTAWALGNTVGIPDDSWLRQGGVALRAVNAVGVLMDGAVVVLALLLTQAWGKRMPAWALITPVWVAAGLLAPIMAAYPLQVLVGLMSKSGSETTTAPTDPLLYPWVFVVVYGGFIVQGLGLGTLFAVYARDRWGHVWLGRLEDIRRSALTPAHRVAAIAISLLAVAPAAMHVAWAAGSTSGLPPARADRMTTDFAVLEGVFAAFPTVTAFGVLALGFGRGNLPIKAPMAAATVGSASSACWGGWLLLSGLAGPTSEKLTVLLALVYLAQITLGVFVVVVGTYFVVERAASSGPLVPRVAATGVTHVREGQGAPQVTRAGHALLGPEFRLTTHSPDPTAASP